MAAVDSKRRRRHSLRVGALVRRWLSLLAVVVAISTDGAPGFGRGGGLTTCPKGYVGGGLTPCTPSYAFFEFAPASGVGMGTACACAAVTGAKGEALTSTRGSAATCSKQGAATTDIANGDLVSCGNDTPRIEAGAGALSYLREPGSTNTILRSQELDNGAWTKFGTGVPAPTVTPDYAMAPDGTTTAERVQFSSVSPGQDSLVYQPAGCPIGTDSAGVFLKGNGTSGTLQAFINLGASSACVGCLYNSSTWTHCLMGGTVASSGNIVIGNETAAGFNCQGTSQPSADVLVWGAQCEAGAVATSYIPTAGATASRSADSALTGTLGTGVGPSFSLASSVAYLGTGGASTVAQLGSAAPNLASLGVTDNTTLALVINSATSGPTVSSIGATPHRGSLSDASGTRSAYWDGSSVLAPAGSMMGTATAVTIGAVGARTSLVCIDPDPSRCR
jgi:hypothetical protein